MGLSTPPGDWIDRGSKLVLQLGLPTVFAAVLLWFVLGKLSASLDTMVVAMSAQTNTLVGMQQYVLKRDQEERNLQRQVLDEIKRRNRALHVPPEEGDPP